VRRRAAALLGALSLMAVALACGGGGGGGGGGPTAPPLPPTPAITFTAAGAGAANSIVLASGTGSTATRLLLEVRANQVQDLYGVAFDLTYPTAVLHYETRTQGTFLDGTFAVTEAPTGNLVVGVTRLGAVQGVSGSGVLLTLEFTPVASGSGSFSFSRNTALDSRGRALDGGNWVAGTVQVVR
jgi:hypothetical protein